MKANLWGNVDRKAYGLEETTDHRINFVNLTTNGGTSQLLLMDIQISQKTRDAVMSADIIVISTGANDLEDAFGLFAAVNCGGADNFDCFRKVGEVWRTSFDGILAEINTLRVRKPTAQLVTNSNEALSDPGLIEIFGPKIVQEQAPSSRTSITKSCVRLPPSMELSVLICDLSSTGQTSTIPRT